MTSDDPSAVTGTLDAALTGASVVVCSGSGGVGKTTTAAAIGLHLARAGRRVVVVTIDPARRLADALGLVDVAGEARLGNEPHRIDVAVDAPGDAPGGELWATMLDPAATFDHLVRVHAADPAQADRILTNRFYRNIAGALSGTQEYMAAERLYALHGDRRFDVVVVDTPPSRHALDFLDAPGVLARFIDHPVFRLLMLPTRRGLRALNVATQPLLRTIGKVVGAEVLADAVAFFQAFEGMETGFRRRAGEVAAVLHAPSTRFVLVAAPRRDTVDEATYVAERLASSGMGVAALVVNRATPVFGDPSVPRRARDRSLWANLDELRALSAAEHDLMADLEQRIGGGADAAAEHGVAEHPAAVVWVPTLPDDVHDLDGLESVRRALFGAGGG